jgi:sortase A
LGWQIHSNRGQDALLRSAKSGRSGESACKTLSTPTSDGQLAGVLSMPKLDVTAPVESGTGDAELNVAIGHADSTPWPGTPGTAVLLAHDVSYFAQIDQLVPGDVVDYQIGCTTEVFHVIGHDVVTAGAPVPQLSGDGLILDTCWPTNALWYTPNRYLVEAQEVSVQTSKSASSSQTPQVWTTGYTSPAPPQLVAQGLTLTTNTQPMGTLQITGTPSSQWAQSPAPLAVEATALEDYFGGLHSADQNNTDWWNLLAPNVPMPAPLAGAYVSGHDAPLDVTITAQGTTPTSVVLSTVFTLSGGSAPGKYQETVTEAIHGLDVVITNWEVSHG